MAKLPKAITRVVGQESVYLKVDLTELFGKEIRDENLRLKIAQAAMDKIIDRTQEGLDRNGRPFHKYSKSYMESLAFNLDKTGATPNLTLTGDMLGNMDVVDDDETSFTIAIDDMDAPKAFNHITGDTLPRRDFFGLSKSELDDLRSEFEDEIE
jgi:hypothetical protein